MAGPGGGHPESEFCKGVESGFPQEGNPDLSLIDRSLRHPPREPDSRRGRHHLDFVTSLWREGFVVPVVTLGRYLSGALWDVLVERVSGCR